MAIKDDNSIIDACVGEQLSGLRKKHGLNQTQIGDILGISYQQVQKYESGKSRLSADKLIKLAASLNTTVAYFFESYATLNTKTQIHSDHNIVSEGELTQMISLFMRITDPKLRISLIQTAQEFAQMNQIA